MLTISGNGGGDNPRKKVQDLEISGIGLREISRVITCRDGPFFMVDLIVTWDFCTCSPGELRRNRRFDHSPGNWWRTYLLPDQDFQESLDDRLQICPLNILENKNATDHT